MSSDVVLMMVSALAQWVVLIQISWHLKKSVSSLGKHKCSLSDCCDFRRHINNRLYSVILYYKPLILEYFSD